MWSPINVCVIEVGSEVVLVDAGLGILRSWWPFDGCWEDLDGALERVGVSREQVSAIVLTHLDFDHVGGLLEGSWPDELEPAFPGVPVAVLRDAVETARLDDLDGVLNAATRTCMVLESAAVLRRVGDGAEVAPGVFLDAAPGHRPGHAIVRVEGVDQQVVFAADVLHHVLHAEHPDWDHLGDLDEATALATRTRFLGWAADSGATVFFAHVPAVPRTVQPLGERWALEPAV